MLIMTMIMVSGVVKAQFPASNKVYIYIEAGKDCRDVSKFRLFVFAKNCIYTGYGDKWLIRKVYKEDPTLMILFKTSDGRWRNGYESMGVYQNKYDSENTTSKRITYSTFHPANSSYWGYRDDYTDGYSFTPNRDSCIKWSTDKDAKKYYYQQIDISEIVPKSPNMDFLYE